MRRLLNEKPRPLVRDGVGRFSPQALTFRLRLVSGGDYRLSPMMTAPAVAVVALLAKTSEDAETPTNCTMAS